MPWTMCTKQDVISIHPTKEDALPDFWSIAVEDLIRQHLGNPNLGTHIVVTGELHQGTGTYYLVLDQSPVISIEAVTIDGSPVDVTTLTINSAGITFPSLIAPGSTVTVNYTLLGTGLDPITGQPSVSGVVRLTAAAMVVCILTYHGRGGADASIKWSKADLKEGEVTPVISDGMVDSMNKIMRRFLRRDKLRLRI